MTPNRSVLALLVVGLVLLPGPAYAVGLDRLDGPERYRSSAGYVAEPLDASNDTVLADEYAIQLAFQTDDMKYRHIAEDYRAANETWAILETAIDDGNATTSDAGVAGDLRRLERNYSYLTVEFESYYAFDVVDTGSGVRLETTRATDTEIADAVRERLVVSYPGLSSAEQRTFEKIRNATEHGEDYRPWTDEPVPEKPIVERQGDYYAVEVYSHTDDFSFPDGLFIGFVASALGVVSMFGALAVGLYGWWRN